MGEGKTIEYEPDLKVKLATAEEVYMAITKKKRFEVTVGGSLDTLPSVDKLDVGNTAYLCLDPGYREDDNVDIRNVYDRCYRKNINGREAEELRNLASKGVMFTDWSGSKTKLPYESVNKIKMANVLCDPNTSNNERRKIIKEFRRILKKGGEAFVSGTNSPLCFSVEQVEKLAKKYKLDVQIIFYLEEERNFNTEELRMLEMADNTNPNGIRNEGSYLVRLVKPFPKPKRNIFK